MNISMIRRLKIRNPVLEELIMDASKDRMVLYSCIIAGKFLVCR